MNRFEGKKVLVTGAASGIGQATAIRFAEEGANVVIADVNEAGLQTTAELMAQAPIIKPNRVLLKKQALKTICRSRSEQRHKFNDLCV